MQAFIELARNIKQEELVPVKKKDAEEFQFEHGKSGTASDLRNEIVRLHRHYQQRIDTLEAELLDLRLKQGTE